MENRLKSKYKYTLRDEVEIEEQNDKLICPVCSGEVGRVFSTHLGKLYPCINYPNDCNFIARRESIIELQEDY